MKRIVWKRACAAIQGRSHHNNSTPCQDSVATMYRRNVTAIALSDGAGSARLSHFGSLSCVRALCSILCRHFDEIWHMDNSGARCSLTKALLREISGKACELDAVPSDLAATILAVAVKKNRYIAIHLGDGVIGIELTNSDNIKELKTLSTPDNGEYSNETYFITSNDASNHMKIHVGILSEQSPAHITGFILMSDGPEVALYKKVDKQLAPACIKLFESVRELNKQDMHNGLHATLEMIANTKTFDDCSIALMVHEKNNRIKKGRMQ